MVLYSQGALIPDGRDVVMVEVNLVDAGGVVLENDLHTVVSFTVDEPGQILGICNGDPANHAPRQPVQASLSVYAGKLKILIRAKASGEIAQQLSLTASSAGLPSSTISILMQN